MASFRGYHLIGMTIINKRFEAASLRVTPAKTVFIPLKSWTNNSPPWRKKSKPTSNNWPHKMPAMTRQGLAAWLKMTTWPTKSRGCKSCKPGKKPCKPSYKPLQTLGFQPLIPMPVCSANAVKPQPVTTSGSPSTARTNCWWPWT
jgi:hypothetical protein